MKKTIRGILSVVLAAVMMLSAAIPSYAAHIVCEKTVQRQPDDSYAITLRAYQTGRVVPTDIVMILDVSGSMECSEPVPYAQIDPEKHYSIQYVRTSVLEDGSVFRKQYIIPVHNTAPAGEPPQWYGQLEPDGPETRVYPKVGNEAGTYTFYTGAMEPLRRAASEFVQSVAHNADVYGADHRIAVVEFSSPVPKNDSALCTHDNPYYANILSGETPQDALRSAAGERQALCDIFAALTAGGPTYSDDAMAQAEAILRADTRTDRNRVVILFTDGGPGSYGWGTYDLDDSAMPTANGAIACAARMKADGVKIYTIGVFNAENLNGSTGQTNERYLNYISSNYPDAVSMQQGGAQSAEGYCSVGALEMDLSGVFADISSVIGEPIGSASVHDTVSRYFYMTAAQQQALAAQYPNVCITEMPNGETQIVVPDVDLPPVAPDAADDAGVFSMTFFVTAREAFLGGCVETNVGACGVFTQDGVQLAAFARPQVTVPVSQEALDGLLRTKTPPALYAGHTLYGTDLYEDLSDSWFADGADVRYVVTDADGVPITQDTPQTDTTYTVTVYVTVDGETYTRQQDVPVRPIPNTVCSVEIVQLPTRTTYTVGETVDLEGLTAYAWMADGSAQRIDNRRFTVTPQTLDTAGTQCITLEYDGAVQTFTVTVQPPEAVKLTVIRPPQTPTCIYRKAPDFRGLCVQVEYADGTKKTVEDLSAMQIAPLSDARVRRGARTYTVSVEGLHTTFAVQMKMVWWQYLVVILLFGWIWY